MSYTTANLENAFSGESQANRKYIFFAEKAEEEGHRRVARMFRAVADAETAHARNHLKAMQGVKTTRENLAKAINGENHEFTKMYPDFIKQARQDGEEDAAKSFDLANQVEEIHHKLYTDTLARLEKGEEMDLKPFFVCKYCGNTVEGAAPEKCPICGAPRRMFKQID